MEKHRMLRGILWNR